jgi:hypothetical protein
MAETKIVALLKAQTITEDSQMMVPAGSIVLSPEHVTQLVAEMRGRVTGSALFIAAYVKAFQKRYGEKSRPDLSGKVQGEIKRLLKDVPIERAVNLVQVYLQMETPWFKTKCYDISTLMQNLNPVGIALDTGSDESNQKLDFSWMNESG